MGTADEMMEKSQDFDETVSCSQGSQSSSLNEEEGHEIPEESLCVYEYEAAVHQSTQSPCTQQKSKKQEGGKSTGDLHADVITFIQSGPEVHRQCLTYDPLCWNHSLTTLRRG